MPQKERDEQPQISQNEERQTRNPGSLPFLRNQDVPYRQSIIRGVKSQAGNQALF